MPDTTIALIDDHKLLRSGLAAIIDSFDGYRVVLEADHGQHFIDQLTTIKAPDLVLLDINMPVLDGYQTAQWIRDHLPHTRVLVLTMMENDAAIIRMLKLGAKGYLLKDSKPLVLRQALNSVRDQGFYINDLVSSRMLHYIHKDAESAPARTAALTLNFTERELLYLRLACSEKTHKEIAQEMNVSPRTIDSYRDALFEKCGVGSRVGLVLFAIKNGIVVL